MLAGLCLTLLTGAPTQADADDERRVVDDLGRPVTLAAPAQRIIALSPHIAENLFAIGAGDRLVGAVSYSDYPEAAKAVPRVGTYDRLDMEIVLSLKPDLVISWVSSGTRPLAQRLEELGLTVFYSESRTFEDVAHTFERLGVLTGQDGLAARRAARIRRQVAELRQHYAGAAPVRVFYQVWDQPLMTVSEPHLIAEAIALCGGDNVFGGMDNPIPRISIENVLAADPEVIVAGGMGEANRDWLEAWRRWPQLRAVQTDRLVFIPPSLIQRHTERAVEGATRLCDALQQARMARQTAP